MTTKRSSSLLQSSLAPTKPLKINYSSEILLFFYKNLNPSDGINSPEIYEKLPEIRTFNDLLNNNACLKRIYSLIIDNIQCQSYKDAIFYVEKLMNLTNGHPLVVYMLGECYYHNDDYKKVHSLFSKYKLLNYNQNFQILAARSLVIRN